MRIDTLLFVEFRNWLSCVPDSKNLLMDETLSAATFHLAVLQGRVITTIDSKTISPQTENLIAV